MSTAALSTRGLDKSFGSLVVAKNIELDLPRGARYALIGPNGAGKTTLINLITGMLRPDKGASFWKRTRSLRSGRRNASSVVWCGHFRSTPCFPTSVRSRR